MSSMRWDPCVIQEADDFDSFLRNYINQLKRRCFIIGGAGFDPRATILPKKLNLALQCDKVGLFFREERNLDQPLLRSCADHNESMIKGFIPNSKFPRIEIFAGGVTAIGGRSAVEVIRNIDFSKFTDIFVDISSLSCGEFFSIKVVRPGYDGFVGIKSPRWKTILFKLIGKDVRHASEAYDLKGDVEIVNDGTIENLYNKVDEALKIYAVNERFNFYKVKNEK